LRYCTFDLQPCLKFSDRLNEIQALRFVFKVDPMLKKHEYPGWFNFSKSAKNQDATLILLKFNIIFYVEKKKIQINHMMFRGAARSLKFALLYSLENLYCAA
jgi:hypothetical protein